MNSEEKREIMIKCIEMAIAFYCGTECQASDILKTANKFYSQILKAPDL
jgi:hypothetical protein